MLAINLIWFYLCLVAVPQVIASTRVNTTSSDGKVFISGDHNEVLVSTARESKIELAEIKSKLESLDKKYKEFSTRLSSLERKGSQYFLTFKFSRVKIGLTSSGVGKIETRRCIQDILNVGYRIK